MQITEIKAIELAESISNKMFGPYDYDLNHITRIQDDLQASLHIKPFQ